MENEKRNFLKGLLVPDNTGGTPTMDLPKPIAAEVIKKIEEVNWCRKLFRVLNVPARTLTVPVVAYDYDNVKQAAIGGAPSSLSDTTPSVGSIVLEPGKLAAKGTLNIDDVNDASLDVVDMLLENFAIAFGRAEERAMLLGTERDRSKTTLLSIFMGLYTIAADHCSNTPVTYDPSTAYAVVDAVSEAIKTLGVYARNKGDLVLIVSSTMADYLRKDKSLRYNMLGEAGVVKSGDLPRVFGVEVVESTYLDDQGQGTNKAAGILLPKSEAVIGDRRMFKVTPDNDPANDAIDYYAYESVDFQLKHKTSSTYDAIVLIDQVS